MRLLIAFATIARSCDGLTTSGATMRIGSCTPAALAATSPPYAAMSSFMRRGWSRSAAGWVGKTDRIADAFERQRAPEERGERRRVEHRLHAPAAEEPAEPEVGQETKARHEKGREVRTEDVADFEASPHARERHRRLVEVAG